MNDMQAQATTSTPGAAHSVMFGLIAAAHAIEARLEQGLATVGLSPAKHAVLSQLARAGQPLTLSELAARVSCVRSNMTQLVDRLEADGLVRRVDDPDDRRIVRAAITPLGEEREAAGANQVRQIQSEFAAALPESDRAALERALAALG
jgi:DNA-binding MarR family transcriptional regulator